MSTSFFEDEGNRELRSALMQNNTQGFHLFPIHYDKYADAAMSGGKILVFISTSFVIRFRRSPSSQPKIKSPIAQFSRHAVSPDTFSGSFRVLLYALPHLRIGYFYLLLEAFHTGTVVPGSGSIWFEVEDRWWISRLVHRVQGTEFGTKLQDIAESFGIARHYALSKPTVVTYREEPPRPAQLSAFPDDPTHSPRFGHQTPNPSRGNSRIFHWRLDRSHQIGVSNIAR